MLALVTHRVSQVAVDLLTYPRRVERFDKNVKNEETVDPGTPRQRESPNFSRSVIRRLCEEPRRSV